MTGVQTCALPIFFPIMLRLCVTYEINSCHLISSISSSIFTNPCLSYKGRPISVASNAICNTPCSFACSISYRTTIRYQYFHFDLRFHVPYFYMISQNHYIINNNRNFLRLFPSLQYIFRVRKVNRGYAEESSSSVPIPHLIFHLSFINISTNTFIINPLKFLIKFISIQFYPQPFHHI